SRAGVLQKVKPRGDEVGVSGREAGDVPPGRARLVTSPMATGSGSAMNTKGTALVTFLAATALPAGAATITSTLSSISSAASAGSRPIFACRISLLDDGVLTFDISKLPKPFL